MGNLSVNYNHFSSIGRNELAGSRPEQTLSGDSRQALDEARTTTEKLLATGVVGSEAKDATAAFQNLQKVSRLTEGDVNLVNIKAAVDLGKLATQGEIQEAFGNAATPLGAVISVGTLGTKIHDAKEDPNAQNVKALITTTRDASVAFSQLGKLLVANSDKVAELTTRFGGDIGLTVARGLGSKPAAVVKAGLEGSSKMLGRVSTGLSYGVAALDLVIAGQDIKNFWDNPNTKSFAKMSLGLVAAGASVLAATRLPGLSTKATVVAALADVGKIGVDVNWVGVYDGTKTQVGNFVSDRVYDFKQEVLVSRLPQGAVVSNVSANSAALPLLKNGVIGQSLKAA